MSKISVITPTHETVFLLELYESLIAQTMPDWEWVILLNGGATERDLPFPLTDKRVKIYSSENTGNVGSLKKEACSYCNSLYIAEVDHDDILTSDCLEKVYNAFKENPHCGFVFSDNAKLTDSFVPYNPEYGWTFKKFAWKDKELYAMNTLPLYPGNITHIWWSPDHIRAWDKEIYDKIGGHDESLEICDDNDLMCRMYLETDFYHIPEVLYVYRIREDGHNTWLKRNADIQKTTREIHLKYIERIALKWCQRNNLLAIDICGGHNSPEGYISVDLQNSDIIADLNERWPFDNGEVGLVRAFDAIEHLKNPIHTMSEVWRILAPGGVFFSMTPSTDGRGAFQDPTHVSFWNENSFMYWTQKNIAAFINNKDKIYRSLHVSTFFPSEWHESIKVCYTRAILDKNVVL